MNHLYSFWDFVNEEVNEFKDFTPLYHICGSDPFVDPFSQILKSDSLLAGWPMRGPLGVCLTRSREFSHDTKKRGATPRLILNRELLERDGYKSYPVDEWALSGGEDHPLYFDVEYEDPPTKRPFYSPELIKKYHYGKSQFPKIKSGERPISHNVPGIKQKRYDPSDTTDSYRLEVEYEERILKDIKNLGKYIYALNFENQKQMNNWKDEILKYLEKYPHIKIFFGNYDFVEYPTPYHVIETDVDESEIKLIDSKTILIGNQKVKLPQGEWTLNRIESPKRKYQKTKIVLNR